MTRNNWFPGLWPTVTAVLLAMTLAGCTSTASTASQTSYQGAPSSAGVPLAATKPVPRVQDCGVLNTGTPSRFVCNGKVYTSFQLAKLREDEAKRYAAGK